MNLFFRLIALLLRNLISGKRIGYLDAARLRFRVWITDQDAFQHMNNSRYYSIADLAVIDLIMRTGVGAPMRKRGIMPIIVYKSCHFYKMLKFPQSYTVTSRFSSWEGPYVFFEHLFEREGQLHARAISVGRLVGRRGEKPTVQEAISLLGWEDVPESPPLNREERQILDEILAQRASIRAAAE